MSGDQVEQHLFKLGYKAEVMVGYCVSCESVCNRKDPTSTIPSMPGIAQKIEHKAARHARETNVTTANSSSEEGLESYSPRQKV